MKKLVILLTAPLFLSGCMFFYRSLDYANNAAAGSTWKTDNCQIRYDINRVVMDPGYTFSPGVADWEKWTRETIQEVGCTPRHTEPGEKPDLLVKVLEFGLPYEYGQGERWLSTLTLFLVPISVEKTQVRKYEFTFAGSPAREVSVNQKGWLGLIFIPAFLFSELSYPEKRIFTSQLREYLSQK
jgi:hypothetical protein